MFVSSFPSYLCFPTHPPFFFKDSDFSVKYHFIDGSLFTLFLQCSYPVVLMKMFFKCFSHAGVSLNHSPLAFHVFRSVEDISGDSCFHSRSVQAISRLLSHSSHLIQPVQSHFQVIISTVFLLSGP